MKKKKIFIALNNYEYPNPLMNYGVQLAKTLDKPATLRGVEKVPNPETVVSVVPSETMIPNATVMTDVLERAEVKMGRLVLAAKEIWRTVDSDVEIGFLEPRLATMVEEEQPYLMIVNGSNKLTTLHEWFGTYETRLAENVDVPVLVVPENEAWKPLKQIVYLMDINDNGVENMRVLSQIAVQTGADITVAVVSEDMVKEKNVKFLTMIKTFRQVLQYKNMTYIQVFADEAADKVGEIIKNKNADWLAFQHKDRNLLQRIFNNYNTQRLLLQAEVPVLVF